MTEHLRPEEFVDLLDGRAPGAAHPHLTACAECRAQLEDLRAVLQESAGLEAGSPSPLFWDHFSEHVREATAALPARSPWWEGLWRPAAVFAAAAATVVLAVVLRPLPSAAPVVPVAVTAEASAAVLAEIPDDGSWSLVVGLASELSYTDVKELAQPRAGIADVMIEELTPAQRVELMRLLEKETGAQ